MSRLEKIRALLQADPQDTFLRYALAMELKSTNQYDESRQVFEDLMRGSPPHVPSFFMCGQMFVEQELVNDARSVLRVGIEEARKQGDSHAAGEMSEFLSSLGGLGE